jgi:hypothetical protein
MIVPIISYYTDDKTWGLYHIVPINWCIIIPIIQMIKLWPRMFGFHNFKLWGELQNAADLRLRWRPDGGEKLLKLGFEVPGPNLRAPKWRPICCHL